MVSDSNEWRGGRVNDTESFIKKAKWKHGDGVWDYSNTFYVKSKKKVEIICGIHGSFLMTPIAHLNGQGCPGCWCDRYRSNSDEFIKKAKSIHGDTKYNYDSVIYVNSKTKVEIICNIHGSFLMRPGLHLKGSGCYECGVVSRTEKMRSNKEDFIESAKLQHGDRYDYSNVKYTTNKSKVKILCRDHGEFSMRPNDHLSGKGCLECYNEIRSWRLSEEQRLSPNYKTYLVTIKNIVTGETTHKVGITSLSVEGRFSTAHHDSLKLEKIHKVFKGLGGECEDFEGSLIKILRDNRAIMKSGILKDTRVGGWTECFNDDNILEMFKYIFDAKIKEYGRT